MYDFFKKKRPKLKAMELHDSFPNGQKGRKGYTIVFQMVKREERVYDSKKVHLHQLIAW